MLVVLKHFMSAPNNVQLLRMTFLGWKTATANKHVDNILQTNRRLQFSATALALRLWKTQVDSAKQQERSSCQIMNLSKKLQVTKQSVGLNRAFCVSSLVKPAGWNDTTDMLVHVLLLFLA